MAGRERAVRELDDAATAGQRPLRWRGPALAAEVPRAASVLGAAGLFLLTGCASTSNHIVADSRELAESSSAPTLRAVDDVGPSDVLLTSPLAPQPGDGVAVVGEVLWLHGSSIGRLPTVLVAGQSVPVLARTEDQGVVVRVPPGAPAGAQTVVLANDHGESRAPVTIVRRVVVRSPDSGELFALTEGSEGPEGPAHPLGVSADDFTTSEEGRALYALRGGRLEVLALAAQGGPRVVGSVDLGVAAIGAPWSSSVATYDGRAALFVHGEKGVAVFETTSPLRPVLRTTFRWPRALGNRPMRRASVSPDGRWLALADADDSTVSLLALGDQAAVAADENPLPELRANAIADLAFARDGRRLFLLLGPTADGLRVGNPEATSLVVLSLSPDRRRWSTSSRTPLPDIKWPTALREARVRHLQSGASIRRPSSTLPLFVAGQAAAGIAQAVVLRIEGEAVKPMATVQGTILGLAEAPDARWLLANVADAGRTPGSSAGNPRVVGLIVDDRPGPTETVSLGEGATNTPGRTTPVPARSLEVQP